MDDPNFIVQGLWSDGSICGSEDGSDDLNNAISKAKALVRSSYFEGSYVRVITRDGDLEWSSRD